MFQDDRSDSWPPISHIRKWVFFTTISSTLLPMVGDVWTTSFIKLLKDRHHKNSFVNLENLKQVLSLYFYTNQPSLPAPMMVIASNKTRTLENICADKYLDKEQLLKKGSFFCSFNGINYRLDLDRRELCGVSLHFRGQNANNPMPCYRLEQNQSPILKEQVSRGLCHQHLQSSNHWIVGYHFKDCLCEKRHLAQP